MKLRVKTIHFIYRPSDRVQKKLRKLCRISRRSHYAAKSDVLCGKLCDFSRVDLVY